MGKVGLLFIDGVGKRPLQAGLAPMPRLRSRPAAAKEAHGPGLPRIMRRSWQHDLTGAPFGDTYRFVVWLLAAPLFLIAVVLATVLPKGEAAPDMSNTPGQMDTRVLG